MKPLFDVVKPVLFAAALLLAPAAFAAPFAAHHVSSERRHWVPEFDPAAGGALVALLAGGALTIASRRKAK